jgi:hypothetical protein
MSFNGGKSFRLTRNSFFLLCNFTWKNNIVNILNTSQRTKTIARMMLPTIEAQKQVGILAGISSPFLANRS